MYGMPPFSYFEGGGKNFCRNPRLPTAAARAVGGQGNPREDSGARVPKFPAVERETIYDHSYGWRGIKPTLQTAYAHSVDSSTW
jgi:hypothetical protein